MSRLLNALLGRVRRGEEGWLIVEAMIGAVVLIIAGLAIYNGLDGASKASGRNRNRTVAAYLAQQDQERMRTMDAAALSNNYTNSRFVTIASVKYTVNSAATPINDSTGSVSCTNNSSSAHYLKITSTVSDPSNQNAPVVQDSLLSPKPDDGNSAVQIVDRTGTTGVPGVPVTLQQSPSSTVTTDSQGCSLFTFLDNSVNYTVGFSLPNYVNVNGVNAVTGPITVVPGNVSTTQFQYDKAGSITANFPAGNACVGISVANTHLKLTPAVRNGSAFPQSNCVTSGTGNANTAAGLFPFTDAYAVYGGVCTTNDPNKYGQTPTFAPILTAGGSQSVTPTEPPVTVNVNRRTTSSGSGTALSLANVVFTSTDCSANTFSTIRTGATGSAATLGLPYGAYSVCVDDKQSFPGSPHKASTTFTNNTATGKTLSTILIDASTSSTQGSC
jgi:Tfp pilus assembly protein PilV